jgi:hypothetical protein
MCPTISGPISSSCLQQLGLDEKQFSTSFILSLFIIWVFSLKKSCLPSPPHPYLFNCIINLYQYRLLGIYSLLIMQLSPNLICCLYPAMRNSYVLWTCLLSLLFICEPLLSSTFKYRCPSTYIGGTSPQTHQKLKTEVYKTSLHLASHSSQRRLASAVCGSLLLASETTPYCIWLFWDKM